MSNIVALGRTRGQLIKLGITVLLPLLFFLIPTNETFTPELRLFFVITLMAIFAFATESLPQSGVALALPVLYIILNICPPEAAFRPWTSYIPWMCIGGLLLALILEKNRFAATPGLSLHSADWRLLQRYHLGLDLNRYYPKLDDSCPSRYSHGCSFLRYL